MLCIDFCKASYVCKHLIETSQIFPVYYLCLLLNLFNTFFYISLFCIPHCAGLFETWYNFDIICWNWTGDKDTSHSECSWNFRQYSSASGARWKTGKLLIVWEKFCQLPLEMSEICLWMTVIINTYLDSLTR